MREVRETTNDPERALRLDTVLRVLGEEGPFSQGVDLLLQQRYDEAADKLTRYLGFGRGRYKAQAEYLATQAGGLADWQSQNRPLTGQSIRATLDNSNERIQAKIKQAAEEKIPYMLIVGPRDAQQNAVSVRARGIQKDLGSIGADEFVNALAEEITSRGESSVVSSWSTQTV